MMKSKNTFIQLLNVWILVILGFSVSNGQEALEVMTLDEYIFNVNVHHPIAKKSKLRQDIAQAVKMSARGNLDPILMTKLDQKNFNEKDYYTIYESKIIIPTTLGLNLVGGYQNANGIFLNPENNIDDKGLWNLGLEMDLLQGLLMNDRKAAILQAKNFENLAEYQRQALMNDLFYDASLAYLQWQLYYSYADVYLQNIDLALNYFSNTKVSYQNGEKTAMDTLEAYVLYQDALSLEQKNQLKLIKSKQYVQNFLWFDNQPVNLKDNIIPQKYSEEIYDQPVLFDSLVIENHPIILSTIAKLNSLEIEQKLKREKLKPKLKLKYNPLFGTTEDSYAPEYNLENYKWGFEFSMPLLLRSGRGDLEQNKIKVQEMNYDLEVKRNELKNKIESSWQQQIILRNQETILAKNSRNYEQLLEAETIKYNFGESSVFLLTKRQEKYVDSLLKLIEVNILQQIETLKYLYFSNQLVQN